MNVYKGSIIKLLFFSVFIFLFVSPGFANTASDKENLSDIHIRNLIIDYKNRIIANQLESLELKENLEWLNLKIKRMIYTNRAISGAIHNSVQYKIFKINALQKERAYCLERLNHFRKQISITENPNNNDFIKELQSRIEHSDLSDWLEVEQDGDGHSYRLKTVLPILFSSGSAVIIKEYNDFLKNLATLIKNFDSKVIVDGYADIDPIHTKKYPSNFELGATRAANVVHMLIRHGVKPSVFQIASTGKYRFLPLKMTDSKTLERYVNIRVFISG